MQATTILLIRHGETDWNAERRLQGHLDIGLNARGRQQAAALAAVLANESFDAVWSSDLQRAGDTALAIAAPADMPVQIDTGLRERCFGALEGLRHGEIESRYPEAYVAWQARHADFRYPAGVNAAETLSEFAERSLAAVRRIAAHHAGRKIVVVSHGGVLDCIYREAIGVPHSDLIAVEKRNAGINRLVCSGDRIDIIAWGDVAHLSKPALDEIG